MLTTVPEPQMEDSEKADHSTGKRLTIPQVPSSASHIMKVGASKNRPIITYKIAGEKIERLYIRKTSWV